MGFLKEFRIELAIFVVLFFAYSYFHQGGGWNQNSRFDQVRSIVESHRWEIDDYLLYRLMHDESGVEKLRRLAMPSVPPEQVGLIANTGDISLFNGRFYPNKPPGTVLAAVPGYFVIYGVERALGIDPDDWWALTVNAYLTTLFSVSLLAAIGGVTFYRISLWLFPAAAAWTHTASTLTFGLGTMVLPFATMLFDHVEVATLSLVTFWLLLLEKDGGFASFPPAAVCLVAGIVSGLTVILNYSSLIFLVLFVLYAAWVAGTWQKIIFFLAGATFPILFLAWYHQVCFGSVLATANAYQSELFRKEGMVLFGMFGVPRWEVMAKLLFASYRGLLITSPVLGLVCVGLWSMWVRKERHLEAALFAAIFVGFLLMNASFNQGDFGWSIGPRYIIPTLPFISLPLTLVFEKLPRTTLAVAGVSAAMMLLVTVVDPQPVPGFQNPLMDYILPLLRGRTIFLRNIPVEGPVSTNPIGVYETWFSPVFPPTTVQRQWNSFNLGEFFWPGSLMSLVPLVCVLILGSGILWRRCRRSIPKSRGAVIVSR